MESPQVRGEAQGCTGREKLAQSLPLLFLFSGQRASVSGRFPGDTVLVNLATSFSFLLAD